MKKQLLFFMLILSVAISLAQVPNADFENWTANGNDTIPENWSSSGLGAGRSPVAQSGNYSAYVWNWYYYARGWIVNGDVTGMVFSQFNAYLGGTPISQKPSKLHGYYFFNPDDNGAFPDSAFVSVIAKKWNASLQRPDTVALARLHLPPAGAFEPFTADIADMAAGIDPDSIVISFWSCYDSNCFCDNGGDGYCLFFYVDNLSLEFPSGIISIDDWFGQFSVFPSVVSETATIQVPESNSQLVSLSLYDALGSRVRKTEAIQGSKIIFNRNELSPGVYFMQAEAGGKISGAKKIILL